MFHGAISGRGGYARSLRMPLRRVSTNEQIGRGWPNPTRGTLLVDEFFALEHAGDARYEYWDGDIVCMSGGGRMGGLSPIFSTGSAPRWRAGLARHLSGDTAIKTPSVPPYRYPDASAGCGDLKFENIRGVDALLNPVIIVEVLSPTSEQLDRQAKFAAYQAIQSFREYLLFAQESPRVTHWVRQADGQWSSREVTDLKGLIMLESIDCNLALAEIYANVAFDSSRSDERPGS